MVNAAIVRVGAALDQAEMREPVNHASDRGTIELQAHTEIYATQAILSPEEIEEGELHRRDPVRREPLFSGLVHMLVGLAKQETDTPRQCG